MSGRGASPLGQLAWAIGDGARSGTVAIDAIGTRAEHGNLAAGDFFHAG